jgi:hypothetical protein
MSAAYGIRDTYNSSSLAQIRVSIEDLVDKYEPRDFPILRRWDSGIFEKEVMNPKYEWKQEQLRPTEDTLGVAITSTSATSITGVTAGVFNVDDIIQIGSEQMVVTGVASDGITLTVVRGWAGTSAATALIAATVYRIGIAAPEGADADGQVIWGLDDLYNRTQIFEDVVEMSGTEEEEFIYKTKEGATNAANRISTKQKELMEIFQTALLLGRRHDDSTSKRRTLGGLKYFFDTYAPAGNAISVGGASAWTTQSTLVPAVSTTPYSQAQQKLDDLIQQILLQRGKPTAIYAGYKALRRMGIFELGKVETDRTDTRRGMAAVSTYLSQAGKLDVVLVPGSALNDLIFVVDESKVGYKSFKNRGWFTEKLGKDGDSSKWQVLGEYTAKVSTPAAAGGYLYNLGL